MTANEKPQDHLSDFERAVCYHNLPRTTSSLTMGLIIAYLVCLAEALGAIGVGIYLEKELWLRYGAAAFVALILFGIVAFTVRAFLSELRARRALAAAHGVPDARESAHDFPDPFENHILLRHPAHARGTLYSLTDNHHTSGYEVEAAPDHTWWKVADIQSGEVIRVAAAEGGRSFRIGGVLPARAHVFRGDEPVAVLRRPLTFGDLEVEIEVMEPAPMVIQLRSKGFFVDNRLVGRVYNLRGACYLDMDKRFFNDGVLAYYVTMA
jgi:hypothetical protein